MNSNTSSNFENALIQPDHSSRPGPLNVYKDRAHFAYLEKRVMTCCGFDLQGAIGIGCEATDVDPGMLSPDFFSDGVLIVPEMNR